MVTDRRANGRRRFVGQLLAGGVLATKGWVAGCRDSRADVVAPPTGLQLLERNNLVAWCIVPFDASRRTPEQRAAMLKALGLRKCAYDWREEHVPEFEREILAYRQHEIEFFAFWGEHDAAFRLFDQYQIHPQIWRMVAVEDAGTEAEKLRQAIEDLLPLARRCQALACPLGIYNHGGWAGHPRNMVSIVLRLRDLGFANVGIVFNFHHGHEFVARWPEWLQWMLPHLLCINLNGMADNATPKILALGQGEHEFEMIRCIVESSYTGPIGILDHRPDTDARVALEANLAGLEQIVQRLRALP